MDHHAACIEAQKVGAQSWAIGALADACHNDSPHAIHPPVPCFAGSESPKRASVREYGEVPPMKIGEAHFVRQARWRDANDELRKEIDAGKFASECVRRWRNDIGKI
jgi:hypothetical protein